MRAPTILVVFVALMLSACVEATRTPTAIPARATTAAYPPPHPTPWPTPTTDVLVLPVGESPYAELLMDLQRSLDEQDSASLSSRVGDRLVMGCVGCTPIYGGYSPSSVTDSLDRLFRAGSRPRIHGYVERLGWLGVLSCCWYGSAPLPTRYPDEPAPPNPDSVGNGWYFWEFVGVPGDMGWHEWLDCDGCSDEFSVEAAAEIVAFVHDLSRWSYRGTDDPWSIDIPATYYMLTWD